MSQITHARRSGIWILTTASESSYVLHVGARGTLRCLHWGCALTLEQACALLDYPADGLLDLAAAGGPRHGHAGLQVRFADGTRDLELEYLGHRVEDGELTLLFADGRFPLDVEARYRVRPDSPAVERRLTLRHTGEAGSDPIEVVRADAATWVLPELADYRLSRSHGPWPAESRVHRGQLPFGETVLGSRHGVTGHQDGPWAMIDDGTATEEHGAVYGVALAWSGSWQLVVQRTPDNRAGLSLGHGPAASVRTLEPVEEFSSPVSIGIHTGGGFGAASRAWHDYVRRNVLPHPDELRPVFYNSREATGFEADLREQKALADRAAAIGVELFVLDEGWFGARTSATAGLAPLVKHVHRLGMKFGLRVEPEMTNPDGGLSRAQVAQRVHTTLDRLLRENAIDFLTWDMNRPLSDLSPVGDHGDDRLWTDYVANLHGVLDRLRADHPALRIEACAGGGGRLDLGILARTDQMCFSDRTDALDRLHIQHGYAQIHPAQTMAARVTDSPNPFTGRSTSLEFRFHVAAAGVLGLGADLAAMTEDELARAAALIARYKAVRPVVQHGVHYRLGDPGGDVSAVQYVSRDGTETVVLAYRTARRSGAAAPALPLRGLEAHARYRDADTGREHHGAVLHSRGLPLDLPAGDPASTMVSLRRVGTSAQAQLTPNGVNEKP